MASYTPLPATDEGIAEAARMLSMGRCVAFPTETVYGLGANALNVESVASIFRFKGRPLTDPLIVHVDTADKAMKLVSLPSKRAERVFRALGTKFWPGPVTLVAKAVDVIPLPVTAGTGFVGVRVPNHPIALKLLEVSDLPLAAPSANRFGHVSPTKASHVVSDLGNHPIGVLMGEGESPAENGSSAVGSEGGNIGSSSVTCGVGIESTVVKVEQEEGKGEDAPIRLVVFRRGGISIAQLEAAVKEMGEAGEGIQVVFRTMHNATPSHPSSSSSSSSAADSEPTAGGKTDSKAGGSAQDAKTGQKLSSVDNSPITGGSEAPGMLLTHYAPDGLETFLLVAEPASSRANNNSSAAPPSAAEASPAVIIALLTIGDDESSSLRVPFPLHECVVLDLGAALKGALLRQGALAVAGYRDLSPTGSIAEAASNLFDSLRWTETVKGARAVLIADPLKIAASKAAGGAAGAVSSSASSSIGGPGKFSVDVDALRDRMYRAASGKVGRIELQTAGEER